MSLIVAKKNNSGDLLLVITDEDLLGQRFEEGKLQLDLTKQFYEGERKSKEEVVKLFAEARHIHLTGKEAVALGIEKDLILAKRILWIKGIPHAEVIQEEI